MSRPQRFGTSNRRLGTAAQVGPVYSRFFGQAFLRPPFGFRDLRAAARLALRAVKCPRAVPAPAARCRDRQRG